MKKDFKRFIALSITALLLMPAAGFAEFNAVRADGSSSPAGSESVTMQKWQGTVAFHGSQSWQYNVSLLTLSQHAEDTPSVAGGSSVWDWNWHKILGWSTTAAAIATVITGFAAPGDAHYVLAGVATGFGAVTCISGYWSYHSVLGDPRYTLHAIMGTLATIGFAATLFIADDGGGGRRNRAHALVGGISGAVFMVTVGVVVF